VFFEIPVDSFFSSVYIPFVNYLTIVWSVAVKHIGFSIGCTARTFSKCFDTIPSDGITSQQMRVAGFLLHNGPQSQKVLEKEFSLSRAGVSQLVGHMVENNLVKREQSKEDKRMCLVSLTERGEALAHKKFEEIVLLEEQFSAVLTEEEKSSLFSILSKLNDSMEAYLDKAAGKKHR